MNIVIHIGVHKTGTTYIQRTLEKNSAILQKKGFYYKASCSEEYNHNSLVSLFNITGQEERVSNIFRDYIKDAQDSGCHTCIFSSETFVEKFIDFEFFKSIFLDHKIKIIAYMRRPDELFASAHNQIVRQENTKWTRSIQERPYPYDPSYRASLGKWIGNFTPNELVIAPFDNPQLKEKDLVLDFLSMAGLNEHLLLDRSFTDPEVNAGLPDSLIEVVRLTNAVLSLPPGDHARWVAGLHALRAQYPNLYPLNSELMTRKQRKECFLLLKSELHKYRPYFRNGFNEKFLHWQPMKLSVLLKKILKIIQ